jgi:hypothetical protein
MLIPERWNNVILDIEADPKSNNNSDHNPIKAKLRIKLGSNKTKKTQTHLNTKSAMRNKTNKQMSICMGNTKNAGGGKRIRRRKRR